MTVQPPLALWTRPIQNAAGWERVNLYALPMVAAVAIAILWYGLQQRSRAA